MTPQLAWGPVVRSLVAGHGAVGARLAMGLVRVRDEMRTAVVRQLTEGEPVPRDMHPATMFEDWSRSEITAGGGLTLRLESYPIGDATIVVRIKRRLRLMSPAKSRRLEVIEL